MADEKKSFSELLSEAPLAANEDTISLVGALERSREPGRFVLVLAGGRSVTLEIDAVKEHRVLGGVVGQLLVQVDIDRERAPHELKVESQGVSAGFKGISDVQKNPNFDVPKNPYLEKNPWADKHPWVDVPPVKNIIESTGTLAETVVNPGLGGDPWQWGGVYQAPVAGAMTPFALATPHHAPPGVIAWMQGRSVFGGNTSPIFDANTMPNPAGGVDTTPLFDANTMPNVPGSVDTAPTQDANTMPNVPSGADTAPTQDAAMSSPLIDAITKSPILDNITIVTLDYPAPSPGTGWMDKSPQSDITTPGFTKIYD